MQLGKVDINFQLITITRTPANSDCCLLPLRVWFTRVLLYILVHIPKQKAEEITKICTCMHHFLTTSDIHYFSDREFIIYILKFNIIFYFIMKTFPYNKFNFRTPWTCHAWTGSQKSSLSRSSYKGIHVSTGENREVKISWKEHYFHEPCIKSTQ